MENVKIQMDYIYYLPNICGIYIIRCLANGKIYVGQAENIKIKVENYLKAIKSGNISTKHMKGVREDVLKYGEDSFVIEVICFCGSENLNFLERYFIKKYRAIKFGYNTINGYKTVKKEKFKFNLNIPEARKEFEFNNSVSQYRKKFGQFEEYKYLIEYDDLKKALKINSEYENEILEFIQRMDFIIYIKSYSEYYKVNGNQLKNFLFYIKKFKFDNAEIKRDYLESKRRNSEKIFIQCTFSEECKEILRLESEFIKLNKFIDLTYERYKFIDNIAFIK